MDDNLERVLVALIPCETALASGSGLAGTKQCPALVAVYRATQFEVSVLTAEVCPLCGVTPTLPESAVADPEE